MYSIEDDILRQGILPVAGIDEAGRGPLAGPVVAAAVVLPTENRIEGLNDSKKLSSKKREAFFIEIMRRADVGIGIIDEETIDRVNIYQATRLAMNKAVKNLSYLPEFLLIDGNMKLSLSIKQNSIVKGDSKSAAIAAASVIAKVTRDRLMLDLHEKYPEYLFNKHKGYPTKDHIARLEKFGVSPVHRKSFAPVAAQL